ncbi:MAG: hypothetical protein L6Q98_22045 [Anaerolineae bacterium]|nr:hypothetical protein [Anaerolineae bacterium]
MSWSLILSRMWRGRREMLMLLVAFSLVTGFFALSPLYLRALGESALRYAVDNAHPRDLMLSLTSESPFDLTQRSIITRELGAVAVSIETRTRLDSIVCNEDANVCPGDENRRAYVPTAYERLADRFTVVEGEYPTGEGHAAISQDVALRTDLTVGDTITFYPNTPDETAVEIVGILAPIVPEDPFWLTQQLILQGQLIDVTDNSQRFDFGVIMSESAYAAQIVPIGRVSTNYEWYIETNTNAFRAADLNGLTNALANVERAFRIDHPNLRMVSGLTTLFNQFQADLNAVEGTVILFAGGVLLLLFYQLMTTTALILERHAVEWSSITSRGGSAEQLGMMQAGTMTILALLAFLMGVPVAVGIVILVGRFSPLSNVLGAGLGVTTIPPLSFALSGVSALLAIVALTLPAIPAARTSLLRLKQSVSRPPTTPIWARYYLDLILIGLSVVLLLRLYFLFGGTSLEQLLTDPSALIRVITTSAAQETGLLNDPFNLAVPALLITGTALLWLRLFPLIMQGIGVLFSRANGLIAPLALWNIARDPAHYAQFVMMIIATLAIGIASLALAATHDAGAWTTARNATGSEVALTFATETLPLNTLPGDVERLARYTTTNPNSGQQTTLYGISMESFAALAGEMPETLARPGIELPTTAAEVSMQVYAESLANEGVATRLALNVVNSLGVPRSILFTTTDETLTGRFVLYTAPLPDDPHLPYTIVGIRFLSRTESSTFEHVLYIDDLIYSTAAGVSEILDDFEDSTLPGWSLPAQTARPVLLTRAQAAGGDNSLRVEYAIFARGARLIEPVLLARPIQAERVIPVILSTAYADMFGSRSQRNSYTIGEIGVVTFALPEGNRDLRFRVMGFLPTYPAAGDRFLIAPSDDLLMFLNATASPESYYTNNTAWLTLPDRQMDATARSQIEALPGLIGISEAWVVYNQLLREPLPNAIIGVLFAGFWISLLLGLLDFAFYLVMTASRRATTFAVLRAMGLNGARLWGLLTAEQLTLIVPAIGVGVLLGALLAALLIPFLSLYGDEGLLIPVGQIGGLLLVFIVSFTALLTGATIALTRSKIGQVLRLGDE